MPRLMFDSTTPAAIPHDAEIVGGYVDGSYKWADADWERFPHAQQVRICVTGDHTKGNCLDVERGDATPDHAPGWIQARQAAGVKYVTVYCDRTTLPAVIKACNGLTYWHWVATLDGTAHIGGWHPGLGPAAVQILPARALGFNADLSVVWADRWHPSAPAGTAWVGRAVTALDAARGILVAHR
jgi:hypothetical protein